jgi:uncharacterized damage-inducible protein DinB
VVEKSPWVQRRFTFDLPVSMFPNVLERLRGTPARIEDRIGGVSPEVLRKRHGTAWTIQENIGHLIEVEDLWLGRLDDFDAGLEVLRPADMTNRRTDAADYNQRKLYDILTGFREVRSQFVHRLEGLDDAAIARIAHHPRLDEPMRVLDLMVFAAEHDDHHLARISELLRSTGEAG